MSGREGYFISFEGIDSVGKSGHRELIRAELAAQGRNLVVVTDPPQHAPWGELQNEFQKGERLAKAADAYLLLAARVDNSCRIITPALETGTDVLADRYSDSWLAYQSVRLADQFGSTDSALAHLQAMQDRLINDGLIRLPDRTFLIIDDPEVAMSRSTGLGKDSQYENFTMQRRVAEQYELLAQRSADRIQVINNAGRSFEDVHDELRTHVALHLGTTRQGIVEPPSI